MPPFTMPQGRSDKPDDGYDTRIGANEMGPNGDGLKDGGIWTSGAHGHGKAGYCDRELDTNCDIGRGYGEITGKGKKD